MYNHDNTHSQYHILRAELFELHGWAETALLDDRADRQYVAEHLTTAVWALLNGGVLPTPTGRVRTFTHPDVLTIGIRDGWADPEFDPTRIDWTARQAAAAIPFEVIDGRPMNPCESTGIRYGRNELGHWGEAQAADAMVTATDDTGMRWLLMVERSDGHGWALPGGFIEPGETPEDASARELGEETGLELPDSARLLAGPATYVPDPRASDEAWMVTFLTRVDLGQFPTSYDFPIPQGGDDATRAAWLPAPSYEALATDFDRSYAMIFPAHRAMLADALNA